MALNQLQVGQQVAPDGGTVVARAGRGGEAIVSELSGRFYEMALRGTLYRGGMALTSISNATFQISTTDATATPIVGVWNPAGSPVNLVLLQAGLAMTMTSVTATGPGPLVWAYSNNNLVLPTTGTLGFNMRNLTQTGGYGKCLAGVAQTGKSNANAVLSGSALGGGSAENVSFVATAVAMQTTMVPSVENIDGGIIVPPGSTVGLFATATPVAHSATSYIIWAEVPI